MFKDPLWWGRSEQAWRQAGLSSTPEGVIGGPEAARVPGAHPDVSGMCLGSWDHHHQGDQHS